MRRLVSFLLLGLAAASQPAWSQAQDYPARMVRVVVPFPPGATVDSLARLLASKLKDKFGQTFVVENRNGASGNVGSEFVLRSAPDGYTLLFTAPSSLVVNRLMYPKITFDHASFAPVALVATSPFVLYANRKSQVTDLDWLLANGRNMPGKLSYSSPGLGTASQLAFEAFKSGTGIDVLHVPYQGSAPAMTAIFGGQVDLTMSGPQHMHQPTIKPIAVASSKPYPRLPGVPVLSEKVPALSAMQNWFGMFAPPGTPIEITTRLANAIAQIEQEPDVVKLFEDQYLDAAAGTPAAMTAFMDHEHAVWSEVIIKNHITAE